MTDPSPVDLSDPDRLRAAYIFGLDGTIHLGNELLPCAQPRSKRWRDGQMALRWCAAGMVEASGQFRRVNEDPPYPPYAPRSNGMLPSRVSAPTVTMRP